MPRSVTKSETMSAESNSSSEESEVEEKVVKGKRIQLPEAVSVNGRTKEIKIIDRRTEPSPEKKSSRNKKIEQDSQKDFKIGYVYLKTGKVPLWETPSKKYYTIKNGEKGPVKNYLTKRIKEGKLDIYSK